MKKVLGVVCLFVFLGVGASSWAATLVFDFSNNANGAVGSDQYAVTQGAFTITAYGFNQNGSAHGLYWKSLGGDEVGIGLTNTLNNELTLNSSGSAIANYIQFDVTSVLSSPNGQIEIGSTTSGEKYDLFGSNTKGILGTKILSAGTSDHTFFNIPNWGTYAFIGVAVTPQGSCRHCDNVLPEAISVCPVPEPSTVMMVALGLLGAGAVCRRKA